MLIMIVTVKTCNVPCYGRVLSSLWTNGRGDANSHMAWLQTDSEGRRDGRPVVPLGHFHIPLPPCPTQNALSRTWRSGCPACDMHNHHDEVSPIHQVNCRYVPCITAWPMGSHGRWHHPRMESSLSDGRIISGQLFTAFDEETKGTRTLAALEDYSLCPWPLSRVDFILRILTLISSHDMNRIRVINHDRNYH